MIRSLVVLTITVVTLTGSSVSIAAKSSDGIDYNLTGEGQLIVFVHGSNLDQRMWAPQVEHLSQFVKVLTYDLRGLGSSDLPTQPYSDASDLALLLEEIDESSAVIVGLSAGVQVALDFVSDNAEQVQKLVLVSPSITGYTPDENPPYLTNLVSALRDQNYGQANEVLLNSALMTAPTEYEKIVREMVTSSGQWELPYELVQRTVEPITSKLSQIDVPTLILLGSNDFPAIKEIANFLDQELLRSEVVVLEDGSHLLNLSNVEEFNSELERFIKTGQR